MVEFLRLFVQIFATLRYNMPPTSLIGKFKLFSDPVHGFVSVPKDLVLDLVQTPEVQRLRRIRQLGVGHMVFPGAEHSRFGHALGAMALMHDCLSSLQEKGTALSAEDVRAALCVALLHDVGHGPFSHTLEHELIADFEHEQMSRALILRLNARFGGALDAALAIFDDTHARPWLHTLISSQLDMDRLDYLRRDSYYTGVVEGRVGVGRIIRTMRVVKDEGRERIVVEAKARYAVENFLISRRLMYWQVYLHKTVLAGDHLLRSVIRRARHLLAEGSDLRTHVRSDASRAFLFFLENRVTAADVATDEVQDRFVALDDTDIIHTLKTWSHSTDAILADLCTRFLNRNFFRVTFGDEDAMPEDRADLRQRVARYLEKQGLLGEPGDVDYYLFFSETRHEAYDSHDESIGVLHRDGRVVELSRAVGSGALSGLAGSQSRPYSCWPKEAMDD
jgi:HD superfamily phosphohydrolase